MVGVVQLLLCVALVAQTLSFEPVTDSPYIEYVSHRILNPSSPPVADWPTLPFDAVDSVAAQFGQEHGALLLGTNGELGWLHGVVEGAPPKISLITVSGSSGVTIRAVVSASGIVYTIQKGLVHALQCTLEKSNVSCTVSWKQQGAWSKPTSACLASSAALFIGGAEGLFRVTSEAVTVVTKESPAALAVFPGPGTSLLAAANEVKLSVYSLEEQEVKPLRWEWVSDLVNDRGGVYDGPVRSMSFDSSGTLWVATQLGLNVRSLNGTVRRITGFDGLPYNESTAIHANSELDLLWVGSVKGASRWDQSRNEWRYFYGNRYLPGKSEVRSIAVLGQQRKSAVVIVTDGGIGVIVPETWTLAQKAAHYETILKRHDRLGLVSDCSLTTYGLGRTCTNHDSDNNGLWTSLIVAAEAFRYQVTKEDEAAESAWHFFDGMKLLNTVTGVKGLMARSVVKPGESHQSGHWHNSTVPGHLNWVWKGDTSSDEVDGHFFAYSILAKTFKGTKYEANVSAPIELMESIAEYIVDNGFVLIDVTGSRTTWGLWSPELLNGDRDYSDTRGVNSLEMLGYLCAAGNVSHNPKFTAAYENLTKHQYNENLINVKIEVPDDNNYSDDELTFFPYYTHLTNCFDRAQREPVTNSIQRTWLAIRSLRSNLWNTIYAATGGTLATQADIDSIIWNLQTWPLELVDWPVANSHRHDVWINPNGDRFGNTNSDSMRILPANERPQLRWNSNPHDLDGGSGMSEGDPGAWLLPYWMARAHGIIE